EGVLGDLLTPDMQARAFMATKVWTRGARSGLEQMTHSLQALQRERLDLIRVLTRERLDFVQLNYSPATRAAEARLLPLAAERGVAVLVNRPFEDGALF